MPANSVAKKIKPAPLKIFLLKKLKFSRSKILVRLSTCRPGLLLDIFEVVEEMKLAI